MREATRRYLFSKFRAAPPEDTYSVTSPKGSFGYALATGKYTKFVRPPEIAQGDSYAKCSVKIRGQESPYEQVLEMLKLGKTNQMEVSGRLSPVDTSQMEDTCQLRLLLTQKSENKITKSST